MRPARTDAGATASCATSARATTTSSSWAASPRPTPRCSPSSPARAEVKDLLKVAAPPYLYSGPSPVASLASVLAGLDVNERRGDELRRVLHGHSARVLDCAAGARRLHAQPLRAADRRGPAARPHPHRCGRPAAVRPRRSTSRSRRYPLVPKSEVGFRIQLTAANTDAEVDDLIAAAQRARRSAASCRSAGGRDEELAA